jgi:hypothetical protein
MLSEVIEALEARYPPALAEAWDAVAGRHLLDALLLGKGRPTMRNAIEIGIDLLDIE